MKTQTVVAYTKRGHRVFLENVGRIGHRYNVVFTANTIVIQFDTEGRRAVVASKGGVIDIQSKAVTQWAQGATQAHVSVSQAGTIVITRGQ